MVVTSLPEAWTARLVEVTASVRRSAERGLGHVSAGELQDWIAQLHAAEAHGEFVFSETAYLVTATRSADPDPDPGSGGEPPIQ
jgi:hypothetical protein